MPSKLLDYDILSEIGSGSYGTCKKVRRRSDNKVFPWDSTALEQALIFKLSVGFHGLFKATAELSKVVKLCTVFA